jgi:hypothetical protein
VVSRFHRRTLELLAIASEAPEAPISRLAAWADANGITLPAAYVEWAQLGGELLTRHSNQDSFFFEEPEIAQTPEGARGLVFHRENQGNFDKIVLLDGSDDPPVLFGCIGEPPWIRYSERFSDAVFAQIFDWQYLVRDGEVEYYGDISLRSDGCIEVLQRRFHRSVTTRFVMDEKCTTEHRFTKSREQRMTVGVREDDDEAQRDGKTYIMVTGATGALAKALEAELLDLLSDDVLPPSFSFLRVAAGELDRAIRYRGPTQLRHLAIEKLSAEVVERLAQCYAAGRLIERVGSEDFPRTGATFAVGGKSWGVRIHFRRQRANWWWIERIESAG